MKITPNPKFLISITIEEYDYLLKLTINKPMNLMLQVKFRGSGIQSGLNVLEFDIGQLETLGDIIETYFALKDYDFLEGKELEVMNFAKDIDDYVSNTPTHRKRNQHEK